MEGKNEKLSIFDFDGTLSSGFIWVEFIHYLHKKGIYKEKYYEKQMQILDDYNKGVLPYAKWCEEWGQMWANALAGEKREAVARNASEFFKQFRNSIYASSYELVGLVKERGFIPVIISAGPHEVLSLAANDLGITALYSTELEGKGEIYTGKVKADLFSPGAKERAMAELRKHFDLGRSVGFGDSIGDTGILEEVGIKVALNPSNELKKLARGKGWIIANKGDAVEIVSKQLPDRPRERRRL